MTPNRVGSVQLNGPATVDMQQCYVEVRSGHAQRKCCMAALDSATMRCPICQWLMAPMPCTQLLTHPTDPYPAILLGFVVGLIPGFALCLQGGLNSAAVGAWSGGGHLTCKDSLLVSWGGGTNEDNNSCPVASIRHGGMQLDLDR
jgi:hypothetical protein